MGAQLQQLINPSATQQATQGNPMPINQGGGYTTTQGDNFNYTTPNAPYWGTYTAPININPPQTNKKWTNTKTDTNGTIPSYSMYIPPSQMPNINAYLANPNSLLSDMQDAGVPISGAGRYSGLLSTNSSKGK